MNASLQIFAPFTDSFVSDKSAADHATFQSDAAPLHGFLSNVLKPPFVHFSDGNSANSFGEP